IFFFIFTLSTLLLLTQFNTHTVNATSCSDVTTISEEECLALLLLYDATEGDNWLNNSSWLNFASPNAPCDWYGVVCVDGHVTELQLAANQLRQTLPRQIRQFDELTTLQLNGNNLKGPVPLAICDLADTVTEANLAYNRLYSRKRVTRDCLETMAPNWQETQTVQPQTAVITEITATSLTIDWEPIDYQADPGHYQIAIATHFDGPYEPVGETANKQATSFTINNLAPGTSYYVRLRSVTLPHANNSDTLISESKQLAGVTLDPDRTILLAGVMPFDNDLAPYTGEVIERMRVGTSLNPNVQVVLLVDGRSDDDTTLTTIKNGVVTRTDVVQEVWDVGELNSSDPDVLSWFLNYARTNYPANIEIVTLMGHGIPLTPEIEWSTDGQRQPSSGPIPPLPRVVDFTPGDVTSRDYLSTIDLGAALAAATDNGQNRFDIVFLDQCFQGNLDTLYEIRNAADVFIGSPNYAWLAAPYDKYLVQLAPSATRETMAQNILDRYQGTLNNQHPNSIFWITRETIEAVAAALSNVGDALQTAVLANDINGIHQAALNSQYVDTNQCDNRQFDLSPPDELIGATTFAQNLRQAFPAGDPHGVNAAVTELGVALAQINNRSRSGNPHIAPDQTWDYQDTVTILAPLPRNSTADVAWRASIYRDEADLTAVWTLDPTVTATLPQPFAYVREGRWDEFLNRWYTNLDTPTIGGWCHYIPPSRNETGDLEPLTLTLTPNSANSVQLDWTETTDETAVRYLLFVNGTRYLNWTFHESLELGETAVLQTNLLPSETYRYRIAASDPEGNILALSNDVSITFNHVYLPLIKNNSPKLQAISLP
ncbi:MAG: clostripain-related cysteine peptidase, partial [Chloroflexota bacterium]